jgi:MoxR-like ATPase
VTLIAGGHLLVEDVRVSAKRPLAHALARALDCNFNASSLLPTCCRQTSLGCQLQPAQRLFEWKPGPVFANGGIG